MSNLKVKGKVGDLCPNCKNCKGITRQYDGKKDLGITEIECEDPYDGMIKTLAADSDICCSMFKPKPDRSCGKCERFDGTYCHGPNGTITISYKALFGEPVSCPLYEEKKESCETKTAREIELEANITGLIKASKRKDDLIQDYRKKLNREKNEINLLNSKLDKLGEYYRTDEKLIDNIQKVIFPQEKGSDYTYGYDEILNEIRDLKIYGDENKTMYEEIKELRAKNREYFNEIDKIKNENISLNTINKGLAEDRKKLINYMRSLKIASENYLNEFTYGEESDNE